MSGLTQPEYPPPTSLYSPPYKNTSLLAPPAAPSKTSNFVDDKFVSIQSLYNEALLSGLPDFRLDGAGEEGQRGVVVGEERGREAPAAGGAEAGACWLKESDEE